MNLDTVFELIVGVNDDRFSGIQAGQYLGFQPATVADLYWPSVGRFVFNNEHRPAILVAKQGTAGELEDILPFP